MLIPLAILLLGFDVVLAEPAWKTPTRDPTAAPTFEPSSNPTADPTSDPTFEPSSNPTADPTSDPTFEPSSIPTPGPTFDPTASSTRSDDDSTSLDTAPTHETSDPTFEDILTSPATWAVGGITLLVGAICGICWTKVKCTIRNHITDNDQQKGQDFEMLSRAAHRSQYGGRVPPSTGIVPHPESYLTREKGSYELETPGEGMLVCDMVEQENGPLPSVLPGQIRQDDPFFGPRSQIAVTELFEQGDNAFGNQANKHGETGGHPIGESFKSDRSESIERPFAPGSKRTDTILRQQSQIEGLPSEKNMRLEEDAVSVGEIETPC